MSCVFARQFWFTLLHRIGLAGLAPQPTEEDFLGWWGLISEQSGSSFLSGLNSLIILGAWSIWCHRNSCIFNGESPSVAAALIMAGNEIRLWEMAGASGLSLPDDLYDLG